MWQTLGNLVKLYLSVRYVQLRDAIRKMASSIGASLDSSDIAAGEAAWHDESSNIDPEASRFYGRPIQRDGQWKDKS